MFETTKYMHVEQDAKTINTNKNDAIIFVNTVRLSILFFTFISTCFSFFSFFMFYHSLRLFIQFYYNINFFFCNTFFAHLRSLFFRANFKIFYIFLKFSSLIHVLYFHHFHKYMLRNH